MNEKHIQQVVDIEKQAEDMLAAAKRDADKLPAQAEAEAQALIEKSRLSAREEARRMIEQAQSEDPSAQIMSDAQKKIRYMQERGSKNLDRAVAYVLERVLGGK